MFFRSYWYLKFILFFLSIDFYLVLLETLYLKPDYEEYFLTDTI